jgi:hypothetical protein
LEYRWKKIEVDNQGNESPPTSIMAHPEQCTAAQNIMAVFVAAILRYAMLIARCQAGKTGAYQELIRIMLAQGMIQRAYILCGSNDTDLRDQAHKDTKEANPEAYANGSVTVLFRQDFKEPMDITNCLIVVDESHMDQTQKQQLDVFLAQHGLSMDGNPRTLVEKNAFIVSVDATPYSELSALKHKESYPKHVEELAPGKGYFGLADYFYRGFVRPTFSICDSNAFSDLVSSCGNKYALMRLTSGKEAERQEAGAIATYKRLGGKVLYHTAEREEISVADLATAPDCPTLVIVRGRLRAGKVVVKLHIGFVWEGAKVSNTDALIQGLLGRMCGYDVPDVKPILFVPQSSLKRNETKVVKASEIERAIMDLTLPTKATNLKKGHIATRPTNGKTQCPPLRLTCPNNNDWDFTKEFKEEFRHGHGEDHRVIQETCYKLLLNKLDDIRGSSKFSTMQKTEILDRIVPAGPHSARIRNLQGDSQVPYFKELREGHIRGHAVAENVGRCDPLNFVVTYEGYRAPHANRLHVYVVFYTDATNGASPSLMAVDLKSRIPVTTGRSVFSIHESAFREPVVAIMPIALKEADTKTPALLETALRRLLRIYKENPDVAVGKCIMSDKGRFTLQKGAFQYRSSKDNMVELICRSLSTEFGMKVTPSYTRSGDSTFNIKKITW